MNEMELKSAIPYINKPLWVLSESPNIYKAITETKSPQNPIAFAPPCPLENMGDPSFCQEHRLKYPYIAGSMAHGINSPQIVQSMANAGMLAFFGTAGMTLKTLENWIEKYTPSLAGKPFGFNLIHSPGEPKLESEIVELYINKNIHLIEASAYLTLTLPLVRYRVKGIHRDRNGNIVVPNKIIAKISRTELATKFFSPPPQDMVRELVQRGEITPEQAELCEFIPMANDITAEADSGGHTDNRPMLTLLPTIIALKDRMQKKYKYPSKLRVGAGGGISTPLSASAVFSMGAAYIVTGSVNQACVESGTSHAVREILAQTQQADITMAPAADMFEMGVKVQVLKRGTMFPMRANKLYEIYRNYHRIEDIPPTEKLNLEKTVFRMSLEDVWQKTCQYFEERDNTRILSAEEDPHVKMALIFRWYLGLSSHWAIAGEPSRKIDYQIWCGPAMPAFNQWTQGSFLENISERKVATVALNILHGSAVMTRLNFLHCQGLDVSHLYPCPIPYSRLQEYLA